MCGRTGTFGRIMTRAGPSGGEKRDLGAEMKRPHILEAILFVAGEPVAVGRPRRRRWRLTELETVQAVEELQRRRCRTPRRDPAPLRRPSAHGDPARNTRPTWNACLQPVQRQTLTQTAMETLAVIAYRQPATKGEVEQVRGVKCDYSVQSPAATRGSSGRPGRKEALGPAHPVRHHGPFSGAFRPQRHPRAPAPPPRGSAP